MPAFFIAIGTFAGLVVGGVLTVGGWFVAAQLFAGPTEYGAYAAAALITWPLGSFAGMVIGGRLAWKWLGL